LTTPTILFVFVIQQEAMVAQLQDQHLEQYMQQVYAQQVVHQHKQYLQLKALNSSASTGVPSSSSPATPSSTSAQDSTTRPAVSTQSTEELQETSLTSSIGGDQQSVDCANDTHLADLTGTSSETVYNQFEGQEIVSAAAGQLVDIVGHDVGHDSDDDVTDPGMFAFILQVVYSCRIEFICYITILIVFFRVC